MKKPKKSGGPAIGKEKGQLSDEEIEARRQAILRLRSIADELRMDMCRMIGRFMAKNTQTKESGDDGSFAHVPAPVLRSAIIACVETAVVLNSMDPDESTRDAVHNLVNVIPAFGIEALEKTSTQIASGIESYDNEKPIPMGGFGKSK